MQALSISPDGDNKLEEQLVALLSHSDGIRGLFVAYLTQQGEGAADLPIVPPALVRALARANQEELIPLACKYLVSITIVLQRCRLI